MRDWTQPQQPSAGLPGPDTTGLGPQPRAEWPAAPATPATEWIDLVKPNSPTHQRVLDYMLDRITFSERAMSCFYPRWRSMELKVQAYVKLPDWEEFLRQANQRGERPKAVSFYVPYSYATVATIVTFLMHIFTGRRPMFHVGTYKGESVMRARYMETVLQFQSDYTRLVKELYKGVQDGQVYGLGGWRTYWKELFAKRTRRVPAQVYGPNGLPVQTMATQRDVQLVYQGNMVEAFDPFMFFPDPRVELTNVARMGEYVFWRLFEGKHILKREEAAGNIKYVDWAGDVQPKNENWLMDRVNLAGGDPNPGLRDRGDGKNIKNSIQIDQGTCEIIPRELGLSDSDVPTKCIITILNKKQIVQLAEYDADHGMHPVCITEPYALGHGFGNLGVVDFIASITDLISWFINSHVDNVRRVVNDSFIVDPNMVEMQDLKREGPGRLIRLKQAARGLDVRSAIMQLPIVDVTAQHARDAELLFGIGERVSAVADNVMGKQDSGGRKTATEIRQAGEFATSRLSMLAKIISAQGLVDMTEQMTCNTQQFLSESYFLSVVGQEGMSHPITISPEMLSANFTFPVNDGTLPLDRVALFEVWKEILQVVMQVPQFTTRYDIGKIFEYAAELGGAKNITQFRLVPGTPEHLQAMMAQGQLAPAGQIAGQLPQLPQRATGGLQ